MDEEGKNKIAAICLAAGQGKRMGGRIQKQYLMLGKRPVLFYALNTLQKSRVDEIILVVGEGEETYCQKEIVEAYDLSKVKKIVSGGKERFHSVFHGLCALAQCDYVLIHDGARPFLTTAILERCIKGMIEMDACVAGMPAKDTIKLADNDLNIETTLDRRRVWTIQTPQAFRFPLIREAYQRLMEAEKRGDEVVSAVTDDAMVVEYFMHKKVHLIEGSYENIKITTPEDMEIAKVFLKKNF